MRILYFFVILCFSTSTLYSMDGFMEANVIYNDSLQDKTLRELAIKFWRGNDLDSVLKVKLANTYILKAKENSNKERIADGYQMFVFIYDGQSILKLKYIDSIITLTKNLKNSHYPSTGYAMKGNILNQMERYSEALEAYIREKESAEVNNSWVQVLGAEHKIAELKTTLGKDVEAFELYKKNYSILLKQDSIKFNHQLYVATIYKLADSYNRIQKYDSAYFYLKKGIKYSLSNYYKHFYPDLVYTTGVNSYYRKKYKSGIDSLQKTLGLLNNNADNIKVRMSYLYLAKSYKQLGNDSNAVEYLKKVDSITNLSNYRLEIREVFELLKEYYSKKDDKVELLRLLEKWIRYEKFREEKYNKLDQEIVEKYDVPKLIRENEMLLAQTIDKNKVSTSKIILLGCLVIVVISLLYLFLYKWKKNELEEVLDEQFEKVKVLESNKKKLPSSLSQEISEGLKIEILEKLNVFEQNKGYLKNDLTLVKASKKLKTNSTYLSKVINIEKKKNFTNYINDLRIDFCVEQIGVNKQFRQYSIRSMATEVGFNNIQSFAKAFSKKNGCNPAEYIKNLK